MPYSIINKNLPKVHKPRIQNRPVWQGRGGMGQVVKVSKKKKNIRFFQHNFPISDGMHNFCNEAYSSEMEMESLYILYTNM